MRRMTIVAVGLLLLTTACGKDKKSGTPTPTPTTAAQASGPMQYVVNLDGKTDAFNGEFGTFFPNALSVHPGDSVDFRLPRFSGVPHTVTLGTLVDKAVAKIEQLGPQASPGQQENSPELLNVPDVFPHKSAQGPPDANQSAGQACYLDTGVPPLSLTGSAPACPKREQPEFNGTQSFYNSGLLDKDGASYAMKVAASTKPGTYSITCLIHRAVMTAKLTVAGPGATVPTPAETTAAGKKQFDDVVAALTPVAQEAQKATPDKAVYGTGAPSQPGNTIAEIGPKSTSIPVGGTVNWTSIGFHTVTFGATDSDAGLTTREPNGTVHLSPKAAPSGFSVPAVLLDFPQPDPPKPTSVDLGSYNGSGFRSTGVVGSIPPAIVSYKLTFTKAGTYTVRCLVHPDMKGDVKVG